MGGQAFRLRAGHGAPTPWRAGLFGGQDGPAGGALARQGRLDEFRRRPLARGAWPRAPRTQGRAPGTRGAGRRAATPRRPRARWPAPVGERAAAGDAATQGKGDRAAAPASHALQLPARFQPLALRCPVGLAAMEEAACAPSRLFRVGATRHAKPGCRRRHSISRRSGPVAMPRPASSTQAARPCRGHSNQALRARVVMTQDAAAGSARSRRRGQLGEHPRGAASATCGSNVRRGTERRFASML